MPLRVKPEIAAAIDSQIWEIYRSRLGGSELRQLAKLFKRAGLLTRLKNILSPTLIAAGPAPQRYRANAEATYHRTSFTASPMTDETNN
jgi:hypothetical protein